MVKRVNGYKSESPAPRLFETYEEAAADEVAAAMRAILPKSIITDEADRHDLSVQMAKDLLTGEDEEILKAWGQIYAALESEPENDNTIPFPPRTESRPLQQRNLRTLLHRLTRQEAAE
jgi:hypothetical protein